MERSLDGLDGAPPSILLLGMRGAGKTTLGRLAAEHLRIPFVDADELFCERHAPNTPKSFVASHGWQAFRQAETELLRELLKLIQEGGKPMVISLGGGIVEEECNRAALIECWCNETQRSILDPRKRVAVVHVFREVDKMLLDGRGLPSWGVANGAEVWERRRPWFRGCCKLHHIKHISAIPEHLLITILQPHMNL